MFSMADELEKNWHATLIIAVLDPRYKGVVGHVSFFLFPLLFVILAYRLSILAFCILPVTVLCTDETGVLEKFVSL